MAPVRYRPDAAQGVVIFAISRKDGILIANAREETLDAESAFYVAGARIRQNSCVRDAPCI